jgi:hypothetical protein
MLSWRFPEGFLKVSWKSPKDPMTKVDKLMNPNGFSQSLLAPCPPLSSHYSHACPFVSSHFRFVPPRFLRNWLISQKVVELSDMQFKSKCNIRFSIQIHLDAMKIWIKMTNKWKSMNAIIVTINFNSSESNQINN